MLGAAIVILLGLGFYAFIGLAPDALVKIVLALFWLLMAMSAVASIVVGLLQVIL